MFDENKTWQIGNGNNIDGWFKILQKPSCNNNGMKSMQALIEFGQNIITLFAITCDY